MSDVSRLKVLIRESNMSAKDKDAAMSLIDVAISKREAAPKCGLCGHIFNDNEICETCTTGVEREAVAEVPNKLEYGVFEDSYCDGWNACRRTMLAASQQAAKAQPIRGCSTCQHDGSYMHSAEPCSKCSTDNDNGLGLTGWHAVKGES